MLYSQQDDTKNVWSLVFCIFTLSCALMPHLLVFLYVKELLYAPAWIALSCVSTTFYQYMGTTPNSHLRKFTRCSKGYYCWCLFNVLLRQSMLAARIKNEMLMSAFRDVVVLLLFVLQVFSTDQQLKFAKRRDKSCWSKGLWFEKRQVLYEHKKQLDIFYCYKVMC